MMTAKEVENHNVFNLFFIFIIPRNESKRKTVSHPFIML